MSRNHIIQPYKSISEDDKIFKLGMSQQEVGFLDSKIFEIKEDNNCNWLLERRGGYSTEFIAGKLVAVAFRIDPGYNRFEINGIDISDAEGVETLKKQHENYVFSNNESVLFPTLGLLISVTPFCDGWTPRPNVFNREIIAFSKERLKFYCQNIHVIKAISSKETGITGIGNLKYKTPPKTNHSILGLPEYTWKNYGSHKHIVEYYFGGGFTLRYRGYEASYQYHEDMPLYTVEIFQRNGWKVDIDGISIFDDDKLLKMKERYRYVESKKKKAVAFPEQGIFTIGCGEKKNTAKGGEGKTVFLCNSDVINNYIKYIDMWD